MYVGIKEERCKVFKTLKSAPVERNRMNSVHCVVSSHSRRVLPRRTRYPSHLVDSFLVSVTLNPKELPKREQGPRIQSVSDRLD